MTNWHTHTGRGKKITSKAPEMGILQYPGSAGQRYQKMGRELRIVVSYVLHCFYMENYTSLKVYV